MSEVGATTPARAVAEETLLDAAERLLVEVGYAGITTRRLAEEAGVNHGLVHYYFGSIEKLLVRALERFTERLDRPPAGDVRGGHPVPREVADGDALPGRARTSTYQKVWLELQALGWNHPIPARARRARQRRVAGVLTEAFAEPRRASSRSICPVDALVSLVMTFNTGMIARAPVGDPHRASGATGWIDEWLSKS